MAMRRARRERRQERIESRAEAEKRCWRCGEAVGSVAGAAILVVGWADDSYSGVFHVPLCDLCLQQPHQEGLDEVMGGAVARPARWVWERLQEDRAERAKK